MTFYHPALVDNLAFLIPASSSKPHEILDYEEVRGV